VAFKGDIKEAWDRAANAIEDDPIRSVRYGKCFRYFHSLDPDSRLLEVGCGEGTGLVFARYLGFRRLTGCEISPERLRRAKEKLNDEAALVLLSNDGHLPFEDGSFDAVLSAAVIEHVLDPLLFVAEIARVVRPGGCVVISSDCWQWRLLMMLGAFKSEQPIDKPMFPTRLLKMFRESGFQVIHYEGFPWPGHEWRFVRILASSLWRNRFVNFMACKLRGIRRRVIGSRKTTSVIEPANQRLSARDEAEIMKRHALSSIPPHQGLVPFLRLTASDENVFCLMKKPK
jgi:SAM-dependent methyltransferase